MESYDYLNTYYENYDEDGRLASRHGSVEFLTTMHLIDRYLTKGMRILEIGAGTGRYSHALARMGYEVQAVELVEHNIRVFQDNTLSGENVQIRQGDARNLSFFSDGIFDLTLLLGPMYHLLTAEERLGALNEAVRVTKPGGVICVSYCMADPSILAYGFQKGHIHELLKKGLLDPESFVTTSTPEELFVLHRTEDIEDFRRKLPVTSLCFAATDGFTNHMRETVDQMDDETFSVYLKYHFSICERPDMIGLSHHTLDVFRRNAD